MQQCGECLKVYDESEDPVCPYCVEEEYNDGSWTGIYCEECNGTGKEGCYVCDGDGKNPDDDEVCPECNGEGEIDCAECLDNGRI